MNTNRVKRIYVLSDKNDTFKTNDNTFFIPSLGCCIVKDFKNGVLTVCSENIINNTNIFKYEIVREVVARLKPIKERDDNE